MTSYTPKGVCSRQINIEVNGDTIESVQFVGGCNGNTQGISSLVKGMKVDEVIARLEGINCNGRGTSCPDQLAKALKSIKGELNEKNIYSTCNFNNNTGNPNSNTRRIYTWHRRQRIRQKCWCCNLFTTCLAWHWSSHKPPIQREKYHTRCSRINRSFQTLVFL